MTIRIFFLFLLFISSEINGIAQSKIVIKDLKDDFGAKGDGVSNDVKAFQAAANFFNSKKGNGKLLIPYGTYLVNNQKDGSPTVIKQGENVFMLNKEKIF